jgi:predicted exporter/SAM-dependent methyltransferase
MPASRTGIRWWLLVLVAAAVAGAAWLGQHRLTIQTDIASSIPVSDPVLEAAGNVLARHPALERIAVDISFADGRADPDGLVVLAERIATRLRASGLFDSVGMARTGDAMAGLFGDLPDRLPTLFTAEELRRDVAPRLEPAKVAEALRRRLDELLQLQGVGQAEAIAKDPLGLRDLVLARLGALLPASDARIYRNELLSADNRHLLLLVHPAAAATDPDFARRLRTLFADVQREVAVPGPGSAPATLTIVGGYRAALDNEETIRGDTQRALLIATIGIALLLVVCFPRPLLGLLALVPATAGVALALLVYSLFRSSISALALGFGGALVSITVDQGIAYLLFLDRTRATRGAEAAHEIWSVGLFATLTTVAAFFALHFSGYPLLEELGLFAGLSVALAFLFIHTVFPRIFPEMPAARRPALLPLECALGRVTMNRGWIAAGLAALAAAGLLAAGFPEFSVDIARMNHVSSATLAAEHRVQATWGNVFERVYVALEAPTVAQLQRKSDRLTVFLDEQQARGAVGSAFAPSRILPGPERAEENLAAWRTFWTGERRDALRRSLDDAGGPLGFTADAFAPFLAALERPAFAPAPIPDDLRDLLGIARARDGNGWIWLGAMSPGAKYDAASVFDGAAAAGARMFDPRLFAQRLSAHLGDAFRSMLGIIGLAVVALVALLFFELRVVLLALLPLVCALAATLGAMHLLGQPIDIPALLLAVVVFGMGIDYSLYFVHTAQRLLDENHPSFGPMRMTVFLAAGSTVIGMASLAVAEHPVLRSIGVVGTLGISFAALGAFLLLPPVLRRWYPGIEATSWRSSADPRRTVSRRYRLLAPHARLFTWFKLRLDRMFPRLAELVGTPRMILDVGCGQGVPGAWLLARFPDARVCGVEPDPQRARIAGRVFGPRGSVVCAGAPDLPPEPEHCDTALLLDVVHQLSDDDLRATLRDLHGRLDPAGWLVLRTTVPGKDPAPWARRFESFRLRRAGRPCRFRSRDELTAALEATGFAVGRVEPVAPGHEVTWFVALAGRPEAPQP